MPPSKIKIKTRNLFISHSWEYDDHYWKLVNWFNDEPNFNWNNCSVPIHDRCPDTTKLGLKNCITNHMGPAQGIIILAGMYAAHSDWIDYEIDEALKMGKTIIGVKPWGQERTPVKIQDAITGEMVNWNSTSIIKAISELVPMLYATIT